MSKAPHQPLVLCVDDDVQTLIFFEQSLRSHGYRVVKAGSSEDALAYLQSCVPDLALVDMMLPRISGFELCARMLDDPSLVRVPIIAISAHPDTRQRALLAGASAFLTKPVRIAALIEQVETSLEDALRSETHDGDDFDDVAFRMKLIDSR